jgi:drug/metabolite transporter (DMT)-like permease
MPTILLAGLSYLVMAGQFTVTRLGLQAGLSVWDITVLRYVAAGIAALVVLLGPAQRSLLASKPLRYLVVGLLGGAPYGAIFTFATGLMPASHSTLFAPSMVITCTLLLSGIVLGAWPSPTRLCGVALILVGLVVFARGAGAEFDVRAMRGDAIFIAVGAMWGLFSVLMRRWSLDPLCCVTAMGLTGLPTLVLWLAIGPDGADLAHPAAALAQALFQGILLTFGAFLGYMVVVQRIGPQLAALGVAIVPPLGVVIAMLALGETAHLGQWIGAAIVMAGLAISTGLDGSSLRRALGAPALR